MSLGELDESWIMGFLVADYWRVGFDDDVVLVAVIDYGALLAEGVELKTCQQLHDRADAVYNVMDCLG